MSDVELANWKRRQAAKNGPAQAECCSGGWVSLVAYGAADAFKKLTALGFKGLPQ